MERNNPAGSPRRLHLEHRPKGVEKIDNVLIAIMAITFGVITGCVLSLIWLPSWLLFKVTLTAAVIFVVAYILYAGDK